MGSTSAGFTFATSLRVRYFCQIAAKTPRQELLTFNLKPCLVQVSFSFWNVALLMLCLATTAGAFGICSKIAQYSTFEPTQATLTSVGIYPCPVHLLNDC